MRPLFGPWRIYCEGTTTRLLGVAEDDEGCGVPFGLAGDYAQFNKEGSGDADRFLLALNDKMISSMGAAAIANVTTEIVSVGGVDICCVHVKPSGLPVEAKVTIIDKKGQRVKQTNRYAHINNKTHKFSDDDQWEKFKSQRWPD